MLGLSLLVVVAPFLRQRRTSNHHHHRFFQIATVMMSGGLADPPSSNIVSLTSTADRANRITALAMRFGFSSRTVPWTLSFDFRRRSGGESWTSWSKQTVAFLFE